VVDSLDEGIPAAVFDTRGSGESVAGWYNSTGWYVAQSASDASNEDVTAEVAAVFDPEAERRDFVAVADAAGYDKFVAMGESNSAVAALWAAVSEDTAPRVAGLIVRLIPTMREHRHDAWDGQMESLGRCFNTLANATRLVKEQCSPGYGCVGFAKWLAARTPLTGSDLPPDELLMKLRGKIPVMVLGSVAAEPAHPVENARLIADLTGGEFHMANTTEEAKKTWPPLINAFVRKLAKNAGMDVGKAKVVVEDHQPNLLLCEGVKETTAFLEQRCRANEDKYADAAAFLAATGLSFSQCSDSNYTSSALASDYTRRMAVNYHKTHVYNAAAEAEVEAELGEVEAELGKRSKYREAYECLKVSSQLRDTNFGLPKQYS